MVGRLKTIALAVVVTLPATMEISKVRPRSRLSCAMTNILPTDLLAKKR